MSETALDPQDLIERLLSTPAGPETTAARYALARSLLPVLLDLDRIGIRADPVARDDLGVLLGTCGVACVDHYDQFGDPAAATTAQVAFATCFDLWTPQNAPHSWALTQLNLANLLYKRGERLPAEEATTTLEAAVRGYDSALTVWSERADAADWALCQMNRANALQSLSIRVPGEAGLALLDQALTGYALSLKVRTRRRDPGGWAGCQMNSANANARIGDRTPGEAGLAALRQAIGGYDRALTVRDPDKTPLEWAATT